MGGGAWGGVLHVHCSIGSSPSLIVALLLPGAAGGSPLDFSRLEEEEQVNNRGRAC